MFVDSLKEICSWKNVTGWQGVTCYNCKATHNILIGPGIKCERCGAFIGTCFSHHERCHRKPDFGFNRSVINWAMENFSPHRFFFKDTSKMLKKLNKRLKTA